jgi:23S rRNA pseudouridine2605 synthase
MDRVQKLLSNYGYCSRRRAEELIEQGKVKVNNKTVSLGDKATEKDEISVEGVVVSKPKKIYLAFNKPIGCVTALRDAQYPTIMKYIRIKERVFPVGRLDYNTSGLLILTNDGDFANHIMHPRYKINKTYCVELSKPIQDSDIKKIERGVVLEDGRTSPAQINKISKNKVEINIHEGRNRIVRRIFKSLKYGVKSLERVAIGNLRLGNLEPKKYRELSDKEQKNIIS